MKRIGIDARLINQTGVGVYIRNLLFHLQHLSTEGIEFFIYIRSDNEFKIQNSKFKIRNANYKWHSFSEQLGFYRQLMHDDLNLMHFTYFSYPILYKRPFIITIHDLTPFLFKTGRASTQNYLAYTIKHRAYKLLTSSAVKNSQVIITPTQTVKDELLRQYPWVEPQKIAVTYEGMHEELKKTKENDALSKRFKKPFFLYVGNFYPHKNVEKLVEAYTQVQTDIPLILIGPDDYFASRIRETVKRLAPQIPTTQSGEVGLTVQNKVQLYHGASNADMIFFYKHALALIHPSLSEGFGLPIVEAANFGLPIIASDIAVFHELLGDSYSSFDPYSSEDITAKISAFITNSRHTKPVLQRDLSFAHMTKQTFALYQSQI